MYSGKKILILGGILNECFIVEHAKKMGLYTIVADYLNDSPAKKIADEAVLIDATDTEAIVSFCKENNVDGIITGFVDSLLFCYMKSCEKLNLPCYINKKMLSMSTDKVDFKDTCIKYDIPVAKTYYVGNDIKKINLEDIIFPIFIKPLDASGSRGCSICNTVEELHEKFNNAQSFSKTKNVVVEEYLVGTEFLLDYVGVNGEFRLIEMFDRIMASDRKSARNYSNVSIAPSFALDEYYSCIDFKVRKMFKDLDFKDGLIFLQGVYDKNNNIKLYEMGCRLGGSFFDLEQKCIGMNTIDMLIKYAIEGKMIDTIDIINEKCAEFSQYAVVNNYLLCGEDEVIYRIEGIDKIKKMDSYVSSIQFKKEGDHYICDSIVDKPVISIYFTENNLAEVKRTIDAQNDIFKVTNKNGKSLLMKKITSKDL